MIKWNVSLSYVLYIPTDWFSASDGSHDATSTSILLTASSTSIQTNIKRGTFKEFKFNDSSSRNQEKMFPQTHLDVMYIQFKRLNAE